MVDAQTGSERASGYSGRADLQGTRLQARGDQLVGWPRSASLPDIVRKVIVVINAGMAQPDNQSRIRQDGMIIAPMDADAFNAFVAHEALRWKPVILKAGLKME